MGALERSVFSERGIVMPDKFEHKMQKIDLPESHRPVHRLSVPGGWLYAWAGGICFVPTPVLPSEILHGEPWNPDDES